MAKLIEDLISGDVVLAPPRWVRENMTPAQCGAAQARLAIKLKEAVVYRIDNVSDYFYGGTDQEFWDPRTDFPCPMPPGPMTWFEYRRPKRIVTEYADRQEYINSLDYPLPDRIGALVQLFDNTEPRTREWSRSHAGRPTPWWGHDPKTGKPTEKEWKPLSERIGEVPYVVETRSFVEMNKLAVGPCMTHYMWLDEQGEVVDHNAVIEFNGTKPFHNETQGMENFNFPAFLAMSLMNCKNVVVVPHEIPPKLAKSHERKGHAVPLSYRTLVIDPFLKVAAKTQPGEGRTGLARAMHITRGHFAVYGMAGPDGKVRGKLFGKYSGRYYIPQHVKGTVEASTTTERVVKVK